MSIEKLKWHDLTIEQKFPRATGENHIIEIEREIIPVIFVPGVMGTRLNNGNGELAWDPDDANNKSWLNSYFWLSPAGRKSLVIGPGGHNSGFLTVAHSKANIPGSGLEKDERYKRGWGGLLASSYMVFMEWLDGFLKDGQIGTDFGRYFEFPLYGFGYNWSADNGVSGRKLKAKIDSIISEHNNQAGLFCEKVILVTHSMGGLVARSAMKLYGAADKVLGVVHGVQPVIGGAAAYKRVRAGFAVNSDDQSGVVLGSLSSQVTPIFANAPGPLSLLPTKRYGDGWLRIRGGEPLQTIFTRPQSGDPYDEIYEKRDVWWRLVNDFEIDPVRNGGTDLDDLWQEYLDNLKLAETFHENLGLWAHDETYQISGTTTKIPTYFRVTWGLGVDKVGPWDSSLTAEMIQDLQDNPEEHAFESGENRATGVGCTFTCLGSSINAYMGAPADAGDGTVPVPSGSSLKGGLKQGVAGIPHEGAFREAPVQNLTALALRRMVKKHFKKRVG